MKTAILPLPGQEKANNIIQNGPAENW